jgi:hypothetical protein
VVRLPHCSGQKSAQAWNFDNLDELLAARAERCPTFFAFVAGQASILM